MRAAVFIERPHGLVNGLRAGLIQDHFSARQGGGRSHEYNLHGWAGVGPAAAWDLVQTFLEAKFSEAERHLRRFGKLASLDETRGRMDRSSEGL
jgi:ribose 5-phosphate isomerase B